MAYAIICVDDDPIMLASLGEQLGRALGQDCVELASSASEALYLFAELHSEGITVPVILSDQKMPGISGIALLTEIHQQYPQTLTILLTGQSSVDELAQAVNVANLYRYIAKPWDETDLLLTVKEAVRCYFQAQEIAAQRAELCQANDRLSKSLSLLQATLESTADGILVVDNIGNITHYNQKLIEIFDLESKIAGFEHSNQLLNAIVYQLQDPEFFETMIGQWHQTFDGESFNILTLQNGKIIEFYSQSQRLNGETIGRVWSFHDITKQRDAEETIQFQANFDELTGLFNRRQFSEQLVQCLSRHSAVLDGLAVFFVDLDHFKTINDSFGHDIGDRLLQQVVQRLQQCCRPTDLLARWGGDTFALFMTPISGRQTVSAIAQRILKSLQPSFALDKFEMRVTGSIGIALYPEDGVDAVTLLKNADTALSQAKIQGRNDYQYYTLGFSERANEHLALENSLYQALERQEFVIDYQPQVDTATGEITHVSALLRWQHPLLGSISPEVFMPIAERKGLVLRLGQWMLYQACAQAMIWQSMGLNSITMAVKLFPRQLWHRQLLEVIEQTLFQTGLPPRLLELEIAEAVIMQDVDLAQTILMCVKQMGIKIALDDFGTGYSSLRYLKQFPFHTLKIDRYFVCGLESEPYYLAIVETLLILGQRLDIRVVAKGVESIEVKNLLHSLQCHYMQGNWFNAPLAAQEATRVLVQNYQRFNLQQNKQILL